MSKAGNIVIAICVIVILTAIYGLYKYNQPVAKTDSRSTDYEMSSTALFTEFESDETASNQMYLDKVIRVKGVITEIQEEKDGTAGLILDGGGMLFGVSCRFEPEQASSVSNLVTGQEVQVKGICTGMLSDVVLIRCVLEEKSESNNI